MNIMKRSVVARGEGKREINRQSTQDFTAVKIVYMMP